MTGKARIPDTTPPTVPVHKPHFLETRDTAELRATWLGHACYHVEFPGGFRVLFDPVFTPRCSPFSWLGPKRYTEAPCAISDIPYIDAVVISHNHYDHLSYPTVKSIVEKSPNVHFFVPLKNKQWFVNAGIHNVTELDWWESRNIQLSPSKSVSKDGSHPQNVTVDRGETDNNRDISAVIGCLPCQHTSARTAFDKGQTLWASWSVESGGRKAWFGGYANNLPFPRRARRIFTIANYVQRHRLQGCRRSSRRYGRLRFKVQFANVPGLQADWRPAGTV